MGKNRIWEKNFRDLLCIKKGRSDRQSSPRLLRSLRRFFLYMSFGWVQFGQATVSIVGRGPGAVDAQRDAMYKGTPSMHLTWSRLRDVGSRRPPRLPRYMLSSEAPRDHEILVPYLPLWFSATLLGTPRSRAWYISLPISAMETIFFHFFFRLLFKERFVKIWYINKRILT